MRTTLTLDEDVAHRLQEKARKSGASFKSVVNETLRLGLNKNLPKGKPGKFVWRKTSLEVGPFESTSALIERLDGPFRR